MGACISHSTQGARKWHSEHAWGHCALFVVAAVVCVVCCLLSGGHDARPLHQYEDSRLTMAGWINSMYRLWGPLLMATLRLVNDEQRARASKQC